MRTFPGTAMLTAALLGLTLAGCDSKAENEVERTAKAIDESAEADADLMEARAQGAPNEEAVHNRAEALRNEGEAIKDHLEDEADTMDKSPQ